MEGIHVKRSIAPTPLVLALLSAVLEDARCTCSNTARRVIVEYVPVVLPDWRHRTARKSAPVQVRVRAWCGVVESHNNWGDDSDDDDALAMSEEDM